MTRSMALFQMLAEKTFCGSRRMAKRRPSRAFAACLAASALIGTASAALPAPPRDFSSGARPESPRLPLASTAQSGTGPSAQSFVPGQWTWASGSNYVAEQALFGTYGTKGMADPANSPGVRWGSVSWTDTSRNLWLFGGSGNSASSSAYLNDLWKYSVTSGQWTWMSGSNAPDQVGTYGTLGMPATTNVPGARWNSVSWTDGSGNLWLFGGEGHSASGYGDLNDLWKFSTTSQQWTWVSGSNAPDQVGTYGTFGTPAASNGPGARQDSVSWTDGSGNLWLFGGWGYSTSSPGLLNDLWKYSTTSGQWTWVSGSNASDQWGTYGTLRTPATTNVPGARSGSVSWTDGSGNLWLFGGSGYSASSRGFLSDLWKYSSTRGDWTWVNGSNAPNQYGTYGTLGTPATTNAPGARQYSVSWMDGSGDLWLFGGWGYMASEYRYLNDLWKYSTTSGQWTWVSGSNASDQWGTYGTLGTPATTNVPGARWNSVSWADGSGNLWLFGGDGYSAGGYGNLNDLWKFNATSEEWTWVSGSNGLNHFGIYGSLGTPAATNVPGARQETVSWMDGSGNLWLFGGLFSQGYGLALLNDLWKYNTASGQWTWVSGSNAPNQVGTYGTLGTPAASNVPGARYEPVSWMDGSGNLWLFGGGGYSATSGGFLNDLWKYTLTSGLWTWVSGSNAPNQVGTYGTLGTPAASNVPGARWGSVSWVDGSGNLWLFGGSNYNRYGATSSGSLNDLWRFSTTTGLWTWVSGSNGPDQFGTYGTLGTPAATNVPGARQNAVTSTDGSGNLWLFGGSGYSGQDSLNDLWKFSISTRQWTWVSGSNQAEQAGSYGERGLAAPGNVPGARHSSISWADGSGHLWLFGGRGYGWTPASGTLNDLWVYTLQEVISSASPLFLVPGVAWTAGQGGAEWQSDLSIFNASSTTSVALHLAFLDATRPVSSLADLDGKWKTTSISPQATVAFTNVVFSLFKLAKGSYGAILVRGEVDSSLEAVLSGKTYDVSRGAAGTVGLSLPAAKLPSGAGAGMQALSDPVDLIGLRDDGAHYTNLSIANLYNDYVTAEITFWGADGTQLGQPVTMQLNPFGVQQLTNVLSAAPPAGAGYDKVTHPIASYRARVRLVSGTAILPYASVVDDVSKDPILVTGANAPESSYRIPGIVRTAGKANTAWRSDLVIYNPSAQARAVRAVYSWVDSLGTGHNSTESIPLSPGQILQWTDFVKLWLSLPDADTTGFINSFVDVSPADTNADPLLVTARVYNTQPGGNVGLGVPGFTASDSASSAGSNTRLVFPGLRSDANFRSNLALFLTSSSSSASPGPAASANLNVYDASGTLLKSAPIWLGTPNSPNGFVQVSIDDLITSATGDKSNLSVVVGNLTGSPISGYATIVDNRSGDGSLVPGTPLP